LISTKSNGVSGEKALSNFLETLPTRLGTLSTTSSSGEYDAVSSREGSAMTALTLMSGVPWDGGVLGAELLSVEDMV